MNEHELARLIALVEGVDFEDLEDGENPSAMLSPAALEEIVAALHELKARRKAAGDEHGVEVPS